jgi:hypothetical protein
MNSMLRKHWDIKGKECYTKLPNGKLNDLYASQNIIWVIRDGDKMFRAYGTHRAEEECLQGLGDKT